MSIFIILKIILNEAIGAIITATALQGEFSNYVQDTDTVISGNHLIINQTSSGIGLIN